MANQIIVTSNNTVQVAIEPTPNVEVTISRTAVGTIANVPTANYANFAGNVVNAAQPNITSVGNLTNLNVTGTTTTGNLVVLGNLQVGNLVANTANYANFAGNAFAVAGANVSGTVANATFATSASTANTANSATVANSANAVAGANVSGTVANATYAVNAGNANFANSATVANSANSVAGANVSGTVANAAYADNAGNANFANSATVASSANSVTLANVSGAGNIASINIDGSSSNVLYGNGIFAPVATGNVANANYANFAGNAFSVDGGNVSGTVANANFAANAGFAANANVAVVANSANSVAGANVSGTVANATFAQSASTAATVTANAQPNITSVGTLSSLSVTGNISTSSGRFIGNAAGLLNIPGANVTGTVANATFAQSASTAGTVTINAQPNITSVGTLTNLSVTGNISANVINANYVNANINLTNVNSVFFDTNAAVTLTTPGQLAWDDGDGTLQLLMKGGNVTQQIGTQEYARVFNAEATTLNKGEVVYIFGAQGNRLSVKRARANSEATSFGTIGFVAESIANGQEGFIITSGALYKLNTNGLTAGNAVYLSPSVAGGYTTTKPSAPDQLVVLGWIERVSTTVGSIYVKVDNGYELNELHDVLIANAVAGQALVYNSSNLWVNGNPEQANIANIAYSVAAANVSGLGNIATINLDGNASNLLNGAGSFVAIPTSTANANYANFAGNVINATQSNITTVGTLTNANVSNTGNIRLGNIVLNEAGGAVAGVLNQFTISSDVPNANYRGFAVGSGSITSLTGITDAFVATGGVFLTGGNFGNNTNRISSTTQSMTSGGVQIRTGDTWGGNNPGQQVNTGTVNISAGGARSLQSNQNLGGNIFVTGGAVSFANSNLIIGSAITFAPGAINIDANAASFSANLVTINGFSTDFGRFTINRSNGAISNIRTPLVNFGSGFGLATAFSNGVSNINIGTFSPTDQLFFRTGGVGPAVGASGGNLNNISVGNITTASLNFDTGGWLYPTGSNVSNVSVGNLTTGDINIRTGFASNVSSVTGTYNRGNIKLNAKNVILEAGTTSNTSGTGTFIFDGNNTANLGNLVVSNYFSGNGSLLTGITATTANYANFAGNAYAVDGANVSGTVANATFALDAGNANIANIAYSVDAANVTGLGNIATINLDGNVSNVLAGDGTFIAAGGGTPNSIQNGNSIVDFTGVDGSLNISTSNIANGVTVDGRILTLNGIGNAAYSGDNSYLNVNNGNINIVHDNVVLYTAPIRVNVYDTNPTISPSVFYRAKGNLSAPDYIVANDIIMSEDYRGYADAGNTDVSIGTFKVECNSTDYAGNISSKISLNAVTTNSSFSPSEIALNATGINLQGDTQFAEFRELTVSGTTVSGTITPDFNDGSIQELTLTGNITLDSLGNAVPGRSMTLILKQDSTGGHTMSSTMLFAAGNKTLSTNPLAIDIISIFIDQTNTYYASLTTDYQ